MHEHVISAHGKFFAFQLVSLKIGLEWEVIENFKLRGGIGTNPLNTSFGLGYRYKKLSADIAFTYHPVLGATPQIGICYGL